jgi:hypothetical protein
MLGNNTVRHNVKSSRNNIISITAREAQEKNITSIIAREDLKDKPFKTRSPVLERILDKKFNYRK